MSQSNVPSTGHPFRAGSEWLWKVKMHPGESLTSLVCRQSRLCELSVRQLLHAMHLNVGTKLSDLDVAADENLLQELSQRLGIPYLDLRRGMLGEYQAAILGPALHAHQMDGRNLPRHRQWILPHGWQCDNWVNSPRPGGIPFCPMCFRETDDPWFPITHRFSLVVVCLRHRVLLWDSCPRCAAPISPFSLVKGLDWSFISDGPLCTKCGSPPEPVPTSVPLPPAVEPASMDLVRIQSILLAAFSGQAVDVPQVGRMTAARFLSGLRHCLTAAGYLLELGIEAGTGVESLFGSPPGLLFRSKHKPSIEFLPLAERLRRIRWIGWIFEAPLDRWHLILGMPAAPHDLKKRTRHPWELIDERGEPQERSTALGKSYHRHRANPVPTVQRFFKVTTILGLTHDVTRSVLGGIPEKKYQNWRRLPSLTIPASSHHRMEHFLRIWDGVMDLFSTEEQARRWMVTTNRHPMMKGLPPVYFLARDPDGSRFDFVSELIGRKA